MCRFPRPAPPGRRRPRRSGRSCHARGQSAACRPSAVSRSEPRAHRARSRTAPARRTHGGTPPVPRPVHRPGRAPRPTAPRSRELRLRSSYHRAARRSRYRRRRPCANSCGCPPRARSWASSTSFLPCGCWTSSGQGLLRALPRSYQVTPNTPDRRRATQQKKARPTGRQPQRESARRPVGDHLPSVARHRHHRSKQQASKRKRDP